MALTTVEKAEPLEPGQIRLRVHGPDVSSEEVSALVFANKLRTLVRALRAADRSANGSLVHDYKIKKLSTSSPTAVLVEREKHFKRPLASFSSGISAFEDCVDAVVIGETSRAQQYSNGCLQQIEKLAGGSKRDFSYAEVWIKNKVTRIDPFLREQAHSVIAPGKVTNELMDERWFRGVAHGSFDGTILEVDLRGALPECKLILSAGSQEIDCVCRSEDIEQIRRALNHRVQVFGRAIYDGKSGLPRRIEVSEMQPLAGGGNLTVWKETFEPFEPSMWESDE